MTDATSKAPLGELLDRYARAFSNAKQDARFVPAADAFRRDVADLFAQTAKELAECREELIVLPSGRRSVTRACFNCWLDQERDLSANLSSKLTAAIAELAECKKARARLERELKDATDDAEGAAVEATWKHRQGEDYGSY